MNRINKTDKISPHDSLKAKDDLLSEKTIAGAFKVHNALGPGFSEKVYENAIRLELAIQGIGVQQQAPIKVRDEGEIVGELNADVWVEGRIIVELKAVQNLLKEQVQLVNYLTATKTETGFLTNFGASVEVRRKFRAYTPGQPEDYRCVLPIL